MVLASCETRAGWFALAVEPIVPPSTKRVRVFISYSHDSQAHAVWVRELAERLRREGVDAWIDQYNPSPPQGWQRWMLAQIEAADLILVVCTPVYKRRFEGHVDGDRGRGVAFEGLLTQQLLYEDAGRIDRAVVVTAQDVRPEEVIPLPLRSRSRYALPSEYDALFRHLTGQPAVRVPTLGPLRQMPPTGGREAGVSSGLWSQPPLKAIPLPPLGLVELPSQARAGRVRWLFSFIVVCVCFVGAFGWYYLRQRSVASGLLDAVQQALDFGDLAQAQETLGKTRSIRPSASGVLFAQAVLDLYADASWDDKATCRRVQQLLARSSGALDRRFQAHLLLMRGHCRAHASRPDAARDDYAAAIRERPHLVAAYLGLGAAWLWEGRADAALSQFERGLQVAPATPELHAAKGRAHAMAGSLAEAEADYRQAIRAEPSYLRAYLDLASLLRRVGRVRAAVALLRSVEPQLEPMLARPSSRGAWVYRLRRATLDRPLGVASWAPVLRLDSVRLKRSFFRLSLSYGACQLSPDGSPGEQEGLLQGHEDLRDAALVVGLLEDEVDARGSPAGARRCLEALRRPMHTDDLTAAAAQGARQEPPATASGALGLQPQATASTASEPPASSPRRARERSSPRLGAPRPPVRGPTAPALSPPPAPAAALPEPVAAPMRSAPSPPLDEKPVLDMPLDPTDY